MTAIELSPEAREALALVARIDQEMERLKSVREEAANLVKEELGDAAGATVAGTPVLTFSPVVSRVLDQKAAKAFFEEMPGGETFFVERETRPFRIDRHAALEIAS